MSLPYANTTITILRVPESAELDPTEAPPAAVEVVTGVRAVIATASGSEELYSGASQERIYFKLNADPCDMRHDDVVRDDKTGEEYEATWVHQRMGGLLDHTEAGLRQVRGAMAVNNG